MGIFKKAKGFIKNVFSAPKKEVEISSAPANEQIAEFIIDKLNDQISNPNNIPEGLTKKQWRVALVNMGFAFSQAHREVELRSKAKTKIKKLRIAAGFKLFLKYFKDIK